MLGGSSGQQRGWKAVLEEFCAAEHNHRILRLCVFNYLSEFEAFEAGGSDISLAMAVAAGFDESAASSTAFNRTARDISSIPKEDFSRSRLGSLLLSFERRDWT